MLEDVTHRINTATLPERRAYNAARTLGSNEDHIDTGRYIDYHEVIENRRKSIGII